MSTDNKTTVSVQTPGFATLLTLIFITLKLLGVITWSWWWVLAPLWISVLFAIAFLVFVAAVVSLDR